MQAGTTTPPTAASMGRSARRGFLSSPTHISYLSSMPTSKKKIAIRKSFTNASTEIDAVSAPALTLSGVSRT